MSEASQREQRGPKRKAVGAVPAATIRYHCDRDTPTSASTTSDRRWAPGWFIASRGWDNALRVRIKGTVVSISTFHGIEKVADMDNMNERGGGIARNERRTPNSGRDLSVDS